MNDDMLIRGRTLEEIAAQLSELSRELVASGRYDLLLRSIGVAALEELRIEAARQQLSRLLITKDYRFILVDYKNKEVELTPVHKAVYLLFLNHPEGIEFKKLQDFREELLEYYMATARLVDKATIESSVDMLVNPLNNSINEKCSRIKSTFLGIMDPYTANYYIVSSHTKKHVAGSSRVWYERLKNIILPRELVVFEGDVFCGIK